MPPDLYGLLVLLLGVVAIVVSISILWADRVAIHQWWQARTWKPDLREYPKRYKLTGWEQRDEFKQGYALERWVRAVGMLVLSPLFFIAAWYLLHS